MDIIFQGQHDGKTATDSVQDVLSLLENRYQIKTFREMHLSITLMDELGQDVELVDEKTNQPYRVLEVCVSTCAPSRRAGRPALKLVVDNTH